MSLRLTLEIVPFGIESEKRTISTMTISRMEVRSNPCDYKVVVRDDEGAQTDTFVVKEHMYQDGAWKLVRRATECFCDPKAR